jgi:hypothetical protein
MKTSRLGWIKRRARRLERFYGVDRKLAIYDARLDYLLFQGRPTFTLVQS